MSVYEAHNPAVGLSASPPWYRVLRSWGAQQLGNEIFGMPGYGLTLRGTVPDGFIASPHDARPAAALTGKAILAGRFHLSGARMSVQGSGDPWNRPSPTRPFAAALHGFSWVPSLLTQGAEGAREAMRLFVLWHKTFRVWTPFAWSEDILARRLINLSIAARRLSADADAEEASLLARSLSEQGRHLMRLSHPSWQAQRAVALTLAGCVLSGRVGDRFRKRGLKDLPRALRNVVLADGSHLSRSVEQGLELLYDLLLVEDALSQRNLSIPDEVTQTLTRLGRFVRTLSHPDGGLCGFQGSEGLDWTQVSPALMRDEATEPEPVATLEQGRFHRLTGRSLVVCVDAGEPRIGSLGHAACDHPMAFEVSGGRDRLIVLPGWSPAHAERQGYRTVWAANTLNLEDGAILSPVTGRFGELVQFGLEGPRYKVRSRRVEAEDKSGTLLDMEHEGWRSRFGVKHERRLYIDTLRDELRGEERLTPLEAKGEFPPQAHFAIRFLLHPEVQATLARDHKSILLRGPGGRGWWLRHDAREVQIEPADMYDRGQLRKTEAIVLRGVVVLSVASRVRWKLSPAEA